ncbi:MAG: NUDIX hydrolase [Omnitrophica WOR_2 bacterium RBG_13_41_10]|nr:MAG: NUDIX hydrolase [Omnitrophica WOR_2 bacterium RBG_13_41_10]
MGYLEYVTQKLQAGPFTTVDAIIEINGGIVIIKRSNPPFGWALPGGFVDYRESLEDAITREAKEETGLDLEELRQFHTYSNPTRDPRFHTIGTVFIAKGKGKPKAGDDAAGLNIVKIEELEKLDFAFDHKEIIKDYIKYKQG